MTTHNQQYMYIILDGEKIQVRAEEKNIADCQGRIVGTYLSPILPTGVVEVTTFSASVRSFEHEALRVRP